MRLHKSLTIAGQPITLVNETIVHELQTPGRAIFVVQATQALSGIVTYATGYKADSIPTVFTGYIEQSTPIDAKQQRIIVRELSASLNRRIPISMRHCTAHDILQHITSKTGVQFVLGKVNNQPNAWHQLILPTFQHRGGGYMALDSIGHAFNISRYMWQQQPDGKVFVGSWDATPWAGKTLPIAANRLTQVTANNSGNLPVIPKLMPGTQIQIGNNDPMIVTRTEITDTIMRINWARNPWDPRLKRGAAA